MVKAGMDVDTLSNLMKGSKCWDPEENYDELKSSFDENLRMFESFVDIEENEIWTALTDTKKRYHYYVEQCELDKDVYDNIQIFFQLMEEYKSSKASFLLRMLIQSLYIDKLILLHIEGVE